MAASKVGGDGGYIDPNDLERAARALQAAGVGLKAAERFSRRRARKQRKQKLPFRRRLVNVGKDVLVTLYFVIAFCITVVWLGWLTRSALWLVDHSVGELWRLGWNGWPF